MWVRRCLTTLGNQDRRWESTLDRLEPTPVVENNVVLYNAVFEVPNPESRLMTQMTAQVFFINVEAGRRPMVGMRF